MEDQEYHLELVASIFRDAGFIVSTCGAELLVYQQSRIIAIDEVMFVLIREELQDLCIARYSLKNRGVLVLIA